MVKREIGSSVYWAIVILDILFWLLIKYIMGDAGFSSNQAWYALVATNLLRIFFLWITVLLSFKYTVTVTFREFVFFIGYGALILGHSAWWCLDNSGLLWS